MTELLKPKMAQKKAYRSLLIYVNDANQLRTTADFFERDGFPLHAQSLRARANAVEGELLIRQVIRCHDTEKLPELIRQLEIQGLVYHAEAAKRHLQVLRFEGPDTHSQESTESAVKEHLNVLPQSTEKESASESPFNAQGEKGTP